MAALDLVEEVVAVGGLELSLLRPRDSEALLDEQAFEREEFLPYWAELWPSALALADAVATRPLHGRRVLELGCGLGVPSLVAAARGARVLATDWSPDAVALVRENAARNGLELDAARCSWQRPGRLVAQAPWDLVLGSDVLYERRNGTQLLELLPRLVDGGEVLIAEPGRPPAQAFFEEAARTWRITMAPRRVTVHCLLQKSPDVV